MDAVPCLLPSYKAMTTVQSFQVEITEAEFQQMVTKQAEALGWQWMHVATTGIGRHSPMRGTMGKGWPDLVLVKGSRILFIELKRQKGLMTTEQMAVMNLLEQTKAETYCFRPADIPQILHVLTGPA